MDRSVHYCPVNEQVRVCKFFDKFVLDGFWVVIDFNSIVHLTVIFLSPKDGDGMNVDRSVFSQLMDFVPRHELRTAVKRYKGEYRVRRFSCWEQFLCMAFAQLTYRDSLRDIETCLRSLGSKLYHSGIRSKVARSTLADANERRSWQIYQDLALALIERARKLYQSDKLLDDLASAVYAFDSTIIELCLALFPWAEAKGHVKTSAGVKLHTLLDLASNMPTVIRVSAASVHDVLMLDHLVYEAGAYYVLDRGYMDFERLKDIDNSGAFFVIRAKRDLRFRRLYSNPVNKTSGVMADQTITLAVWRSHDAYPDHLRRIRFLDAEHDRTLVFLTNNFLLDAFTVAQLYRARWRIELFFKWIKQHLRIKRFYGTSVNAVKTQIWIAVATYVLVAILKKELKLDLSLYTILQILSVTLFHKESIYQLLTDTQYNIQNPIDPNQLILFDS